jgi:hypothetical protein
MNAHILVIVGIYLSLCLSVSVSLFLSLSLYTERERERDREAEGGREGERDRQTDAKMVFFFKRIQEEVEAIRTIYVSSYLSYYYISVLIPDEHLFRRMQEEVEAIRTMNQRGIRIIAAGTSICVSAA